MLFLCFLVSCNDKKTLQPEDLKMESTAMVPTTASPDNSYENEQQILNGDQSQSSTDTISSTPIPVRAPANIDWDKKIIKTASLKLEVTDFKKYSDVVYRTVRQLGGYVAQEDQDLSPEKNETVITIKVPAYQFETMMNALPDTNAKVIERKISTDDVTGKIIDTKSRLEAKKEMRMKYLEFLKQSKNMKEVLQVQAEINNIQEEMEAAAGQVNYLSHQSAMSTINLSFYQLLPGYKPEVVNDPSFASRIAKAFKFGASAITELFIGLMTIWPLILIIIASLILWRRARSEKFAAGIAQKK